MIRPPRRSVTRFFIPLIDVLTLLFCIFLLMPVVRTGGEGTEAESAAAREQLRQLERELEALRAQGKETPEALRKEIERLQQEQNRSLQERLKVRVLQIDPADGTLFYHDPDRVNVKTRADARELIEQDRRDLRGSKRELYYLILYPRGPSSFPLREQREEYDRWFAEVAHGWDVPGSVAPRGGKP
jgi:hypothetical protein